MIPIVDIASIANQAFDYIIVGGGTAGLVVAARLSENKETSVLVLDAGQSNLDDPLIMSPGQFGATFMQPKYDWAFMTVPQPFANNRPIFWPRGKSLGGSSAMNFSIWSVPPAQDIDDWECLGNEGWNFANYKEHLDSVISYKEPGEKHEGYKYEPALMEPWRSAHGKGPLTIDQPRRVLDIQVKAQETFGNLGIPLAPEPTNGMPNGRYLSGGTTDPDTGKRSYAATAFLRANETRENLKIVMGAYVRRLVLTDDGRASAVECSVENTIHAIQVNHDVVLCAGALKSPQILELSGIGQPGVLSKIGIPVKVALGGVGENVQEHLYLGASYLLNGSVTEDTVDALRDPVQRSIQGELFSKQEGVFMTGPTSVAYLPLSTVSPRAVDLLNIEKNKIEHDMSSYPSGLKDQYDMMMDRIERGGCGFEIFAFPGFQTVPNPPAPGKKYVTLAVLTNYNFSRGTIHATSADPLADPAMDPHYFEHDFDLQVLLDMIKYVRTMASTAPLCQYIDGSEDAEVNPGRDVETDEQLLDWLRNNTGTTFHTVGSLSMLPKEKTGVVDSNLKVYGTSNVRVADLSIVPLHFAGHSVATAYAIGSFAAEIIKRD